MNKMEEVTGLRANVIKTDFMHGNSHASWSYWFDISIKEGIKEHNKMEKLISRYNRSLRKSDSDCRDRYGDKIREGDIVLGPKNVYLNSISSRYSKIENSKSNELNCFARHGGSTVCTVPLFAFQCGSRISFEHIKTFSKEQSYATMANYFYPKRYVKIKFEDLNEFEKKQYLKILKERYNHGDSKDTVRRDFNFFKRG